MAHVNFDQKLIFLVIVIVLIIVIGIGLYRVKYQTQEERDANQHFLWFGIAIASLAAIGIYLFSIRGGESDVSMGEQSSGERPEYGIREAISELRAQKQAEARAKREAKASGMSKEQIREAGRYAKEQFREVKRAGQQAALEAREAKRAEIAARKG